MSVVKTLKRSHTEPTTMHFHYETTVALCRSRLRWSISDSKVPLTASDHPLHKHPRALRYIVLQDFKQSKILQVRNNMSKQTKHTELWRNPACYVQFGGSVIFLAWLVKRDAGSAFCACVECESTRGIDVVAKAPNLSKITSRNIVGCLKVRMVIIMSSKTFSTDHK